MTFKRKAVPPRVQLEVALAQLAVYLACKRGDLTLDHVPALRRRVLNEGGTDTIPPQLDPAFMQWLTKPVHLEKTTGRRGTSKLSQRGGDIAEIAKTKRLEARNLPLSNIARQYQGAVPVRGKSPQTEKPKRKIASRPFPKERKMRCPTKRPQ